MSAVLGRLFARKEKALNASRMPQDAEGNGIRKHIVDHEIVDRYYGHDHGDSNEKINVRTRFSEPSFALNLWSVFPLLLLALGGSVVAFVAIMATAINLLIIQMKVPIGKRYIATGIVSFMVLVVYMAA
ncbi:MAG TPA: hypothetical protein ENJ33_09120 [Thiothrix sp.]|nr:hypothetical protein [Thiothrix sp.]